MSADKMVVLVTGADDLLGQHLIKHLQLFWHQHLIKIRTFDLSKPFQKRLEYEDNTEVETFSGDICDEAAVGMALEGVETVVHLLEYRDFRMLPDTQRIRRVNCEGTETLMKACATAGVRRVVLGSSTLVMASSRWPAANNPETAKLPPPSQWLHSDYCRSKLDAEHIVTSYKDIQSFIIRLTPMFGEEDKDSIVMSALSYAKKHEGVLPVLGDRGGVIQYTYAGNVAWGLLDVLDKMLACPTDREEVVFLVDETPLQSFYALLEPFLQARGWGLASVPWAFLPYYWAYWAFEKVVTAAASVVGLPRWVGDLPSSSLFYSHLYYWYFFSGSKARTYLDYIPKYSYKEAVESSSKYYSDCQLT